MSSPTCEVRDRAEARLRIVLGLQALTIRTSKGAQWPLGAATGRHGSEGASRGHPVARIDVHHRGDASRAVYGFQTGRSRTPRLALIRAAHPDPDSLAPAKLAASW